MSPSRLIVSASLILVSSVAVSPFARAARSAVKAPAAPATPAASLREQALNEGQIARVETRRATDAEVGAQASGVLSLKDPGLEIVQKKWKWVLGLKLQSFSPEGTATLANRQTFVLDGVGSTPYPILELGGVRELGEARGVAYRLGVRGEFGYMSQDTDVTFPTGVEATDTRLNTGLASGHVALGARWLGVPSLEWELSLGQGLFSTSQSSPDSTVNFSKQSTFRSVGLGAVWWLKPDWALEAQQTQRSLVSSSDIKLQSQNFSIGTRMMW